MPFTLTRAHAKSLVDPTARGDWSRWFEAIDPEVHWIIADTVHDPVVLTGTYVFSYPFSPAISILTQSTRTSKNGPKSSVYQWSPDSKDFRV